MSIGELQQFMEQLVLTQQQELIGHQILKEIRARLRFLVNVGLEYLSLARATGTLIRRRGAADSSGDADWLGSGGRGVHSG